MTLSLVCSDAVQWAREYDGTPFHALLCDPPYHLTSIVKRFGAEGAAPAQYGKDGAFARASKGFMGKQWDGGDVAFDPATWEAFAKIMYPGAFGMAFASSRGWHRLAVAIEDGGFIIHPSIFGWAYGSGFPKATRIDTQIDKKGGVSVGWFGEWLRKWRTENGIPQKDIAKLFPSKTGKLTGCVANWELGLNTPTNEQFNLICKTFNLPFASLEEAEREVIGQIESTIGYQLDGVSRWGGNRDLTAPATDLAKAFAGHRYGLQALKPALEPIIVFQKPYEGRPIDNIVSSGAGTLNIDAGRIGTDNKTPFPAGSQRTGYSGDFPINGDDSNPNGRWPANFILLDDGAVQALDRQSGTLQSGAKDGVYKGWGAGREIYGDSKEYHHHCEADSGGASRFFFRVTENIDSADPVYYCAKASTEERNAGLGDLPLKPSQKWNSGGINKRRAEHAEEIISQGLDARGRLLIREDGSETLVNRFIPAHAHNPHPTVKPIELARYLATLLLPPTEYAPRRLFIPFAGVASEVIGSMQAGWDEITGIELTEEYIPIANARIEYWRNRGWQVDMFSSNVFKDAEV